MFLNDGIAAWLGLDLDRGEIVQVTRVAGKRLAEGKLPAIRPSKVHYWRETKTKEAHWIDTIRKAPVARSHIGEIVCTANELWAAGPPKKMPALGATDGHDTLYLVDRSATKYFGGLLRLSREEQALRDRLQTLRPPAWSDSVQ